MRVRVRDEREIGVTLDHRGGRDGLPFQSEMAAYCGRELEAVPVNRVMVEGSGVRALTDVFVLDGARCDGRAHGGCKRGCLFLWKRDWLHIGAPASGEVRRPASRQCQGDARALILATRPLSILDPRQYAADVNAGVRTPGEVGRMLVAMATDRVRWRIGRIHARWYGQARPPRFAPLGLRHGDSVEVRSAAEIRRTLDKRQRHRGTLFADAMWRYCGERMRVLRKVDRFVVEEDGRVVESDDAWFLEGATCDGLAFRGCPRTCHWFWRGAWLRPLLGESR